MARKFASPGMMLKKTLKWFKSLRKCQSSARSKRRYHGGNAPLNYSLSNAWSSKMSQGQGADFFKYHEGQHGGSAPVSAISNSALPSSLMGSAMQNGVMKAYNDIQGMRDQAGGRRKKHRHSSRCHCKSKHHRTSKHHRRSRRRSGGGHLEYSPYGARTMLLDNYSKAGLSNSWNGNAEFDAAAARNAM